MSVKITTRKIPPPKTGVSVSEWQIRKLTPQSCLVGFALKNHDADPVTITGLRLALELGEASAEHDDEVVTVASNAVIQPGDKADAEASFSSVTKAQHALWASGRAKVWIRGHVAVKPKGAAYQVAVSVSYDVTTGTWA